MGMQGGGRAHRLARVQAAGVTAGQGHPPHVAGRATTTNRSMEPKLLLSPFVCRGSRPILQAPSALGRALEFGGRGVAFPSQQGAGLRVTWHLLIHLVPLCSAPPVIRGQQACTPGGTGLRATPAAWQCCPSSHSQGTCWRRDRMPGSVQLQVAACWDLRGQGKAGQEARPPQYPTA